MKLRKLCGTSRSAIAIAPGEGWTTSIEVPANASLQLAFGLACASGERCRGSRRFRVETQQSDYPAETLTEKTLTKKAGDQCWQTEHIDLDHLAGKNVNLVFSIAADVAIKESKEPPPQPISLLAEPLWILDTSQSGYNVLLISIDTLRADRLGSYGYHRETSPRLDEFAADAVRFNSAISQSPWTLPSHVSLFTSLYPSAHRQNQTWHKRDLSWRRAMLAGQQSKLPTLAQVLRRNGYRTLALTSGGPLAAQFGFADGFDIYQEGARHLNQKIWKRLTSTLDEFETTPFMLFFHTFEVHAPYTRTEMLEDSVSKTDAERLRRLIRSDHKSLAKGQYLKKLGLFNKEVCSELYDGGIRYADAFIGRFLDELKRRNLYDRTLIVVTSDHGEEFAEHSDRFHNAHGNTVYEEQIRVPLIMRMPGSSTAGTVIEQPVELIDVAPTILALLGLSAPASMSGRNLEDLMKGIETDGEGWTFSEASLLAHREWKAIRNSRYKYITVFEIDTEVGRNGPLSTPVAEKIFDLERDPSERRNLYGENPELLRSMRRRLLSTLDEIEKVAVVEPSIEQTGRPVSDASEEEIRNQLRALGYLD